MKNGIKYKDVTALPNSTLHTLLLEAQQKPEKRSEILKKAEKCYNECIDRFNKLTGGKS